MNFRVFDPSEDLMQKKRRKKKKKDDSCLGDKKLDRERSLKEDELN